MVKADVHFIFDRLQTGYSRQARSRVRQNDFSITQYLKVSSIVTFSDRLLSLSNMHVSFMP